jgi:hypothetical protein
MTIKSDKQKLKEEGIDIQGLLEQELRARHFECLVKYLEDENFKETIKIIIDERNERARITLKVSREHTSVVAQVYKLQKELLNLEKSEIYQAGKWLIDTLSLTGNALIKALLERNLLPKDYHNKIVLDQIDTIQTMDEKNRQAQEQSNQTIHNLQKGIDNLKNILMNKKRSDMKIENSFKIQSGSEGLERFLKVFEERYGSDELENFLILFREQDDSDEL